MPALAPGAIEVTRTIKQQQHARRLRLA
ncbi:hypothetical protein A2U01_0089755, partial [Trifolium medium]|nr:hypothetical protein [Trifolium medium]